MGRWISRTMNRPWVLGLVLLTMATGGVMSWRVLSVGGMQYIPADASSWFIGVVGVVGLALSRVSFHEVPKRRTVRQWYIERVLEPRTLRTIAAYDGYGRPVTR